MSSKTSNKRRGVKNTTKKNKKHRRKYSGGGKYDNDQNFRKAYREIYNVNAPDAAVHWLKEVQKTNPDDKDISELIQKLEKSGRLLKEAQKDIEDLDD
jgi:hypothetical protein